MKSRTTARKNKTRTILLLGFEGATALDITGPHEVFALSSHLAHSDSLLPYRLVLLADHAGPFRATSGLNLVADGSWRDFHGQADTLLVAGGPDMTHVVGNRKLLAWLRAMSVRCQSHRLHLHRRLRPCRSWVAGKPPRDYPLDGCRAPSPKISHDTD